jgi:hypothetical protein
MLLAAGLGPLLSEIILIILIAVVLFLIFKIGKFIFRVIGGLLMNSILGLVSLFILNSVFGLGLNLSLLEWIVVAILGLPAVFVIVILHLLGIL